MTRKKRSWLFFISVPAVGLLLAGLVGWGILAIYYSYLPEMYRLGLAAFYGIACLVVLILIRPKRRAILLVFVFFAIVLAGWLSMEPSNDRDWQADVAVLPYADIEGDKITVYNIRNCDYRTETDFTVHYEDRTFDLSRLTSVDLYLVDWGLTYLVHTMLSFGFDDGRYLCISIETRKEEGEEYSTIKGFFRQYELFYVVSDERDAVRLRTNYRKDEITYLYRLTGSSLDVGRKVFLDYLRYINRLKEQPEWYNALTGNCTTQIHGHTEPYTGTRWDWRSLANRYIDEMAYENGNLFQGMPFAELKKRSVINPKAQAADADPHFSDRIREGLPGMGN